MHDLIINVEDLSSTPRRGWRRHQAHQAPMPQANRVSLREHQSDVQVRLTVPKRPSADGLHTFG
jgi:hypothetical protein